MIGWAIGVAGFFVLLRVAIYAIEACERAKDKRMTKKEAPDFDRSEEAWLRTWKASRWMDKDSQ